MKNLLTICFLLTLSLTALAATEDGQVTYVGGTVAGFPAGVSGRLDTTPEASLTFQYAGNKLLIPYASIDSYEYSKEVTRHLGVLPAIAIGMVKMRRHSHYFRISYHDPNNFPNNVAQVVIFEVPKHIPRTLEATLQARAPQADKTRHPCRVSN